MDRETRMRAQAATVSDAIPLELSPLLMPYGRDRRLGLRIERMPNRARLSRGRNNGDGTWSLTRDELEGLEYLPPKGATESPTLIVRVIGLDSGDGTTLTVLDYPVLSGADAESASENSGENAARREELRSLRSELAKTKTALRVLQSELDASRKSFEAELEERLNESAAEAASALEERRTAWQAEMRDRMTKADARAQERLDQARKRLARDAEAELSRAEEAWKNAEAARLADAEARWREQSARALAKETAQLRKIEADLAEARVHAASKESTNAELGRLQDEIGGLRTALAERDRQVAEAQTAATSEAREQSRRELAAALSQAEEKWKAAEARRLAAAEAAWREFSDRTVAELGNRLEETEAELAQARAEAQTARERRDTAETKRLRAELSIARETIAARENELAEAQSASDEAVRRAEQLAAAIGKAEAAWKKDEAKRLAAAETRWSEQSAQIIADVSAKLQRSEAALTKAQAELKSTHERHNDSEFRRLNDALVDVSAKLQRSEAALAKAQAELKSSHERRDGAEMRRLKDALAEVQAKLAKRHAELAETQTAADNAVAAARQEFEHRLGQAKEEWAAEEAARLAEAKAEWKKHSDRLFKQATVRLEGAEAALAEARAAAGAAQDRREGADLKRLRTEFSEARAKLAEREAELAEAKVAVGRERERNRADVEAALAKAEENWKAAEVVRLAEIETREQERGARALAEATGRLERTEAALNEMRLQLEAERERGIVAIAETRTRLERTESALQDARNQIESMRDPANEVELSRLRSDLASFQVLIDERGAELAEARAAARRSREEWNMRIQAAVMRARDEWQEGEDRRMEAARRQWESDARIKGTIEFEPDEFAGPQEDRKEGRLAKDIALAAALAVLVVAGFTFYPQISRLLTGTPAGAPIGMTKAVASVPPKPPAAPPLPQAVITASAVKLHAEPSAESHVITTVTHGLGVTLLGQTGNWMHIRIAGEGGKPAQDGWVHATSLKQTSAILNQPSAAPDKS